MRKTTKWWFTNDEKSNPARLREILIDCESHQFETRNGGRFSRVGLKE